MVGLGLCRLMADCNVCGEPKGIVLLLLLHVLHFSAAVEVVVVVVVVVVCRASARVACQHWNIRAARQPGISVTGQDVFGVSESLHLVHRHWLDEGSASFCGWLSSRVPLLEWEPLCTKKLSNKQTDLGNDLWLGATRFRI